MAPMFEKIGNKNKSTIDEIKAKLEFCDSYRFPQEKTWWEIENFINGFHYYIFRDLKNTNSVDVRPLKFKTGDIRRVINLIRKVYRDLKAMISVANYRWTVIGGGGMEDKYLQDYFDSYNIAQVVSQVAGLGFKRSVGYAELYWDGTEKRVISNPLDPFSIYEDPMKKFFIKSYTKRLKELQEAKEDGKPVYQNLDKDKLESSDKIAHSDLLNYLYKRDHPGSDKKDDESLTKYLITELIEPQDDNTANITTISGDQIIRETELDAYKILSYRPELEGDIYTEPLMEPILHPAKALNRTINHVEEHIRYMGQGSFAIRKGEKFPEIKTEHGHIYEYEKRKPEQLIMQPLPGEVMQYLNLMVGFHSTLSGMRLQEIPANLSGKAIAFYQAVEQQNATEPMENLKAFMREMAMSILSIAEKKQAFSKKIYWKEKEELQEAEVIGAANAGESKAENIKKPQRVDVEIIPGGAFSLLNQKEEAKEMYKLGLIGRKAALELSKIGNIAEIINEAEAEEERQMALKAQFGEGAPGPAASPQEAMSREMAELPEQIPARPSML